MNVERLVVVELSHVFVVMAQSRFMFRSTLATSIRLDVLSSSCFETPKANFARWGDVTPSVLARGYTY